MGRVKLCSFQHGGFIHIPTILVPIPLRTSGAPVQHGPHFYALGGNSHNAIPREAYN